MTKRIFIWLLLCCAILNIGYGQELNKLKEKRAKNKKELAYTNKILRNVKQQKSSSLEQLFLLKKNITNRAKIVESYQNEIVSYKEKEAFATKTIKELIQQQQQLKDVYAQLLYKTYYHSFINKKWLYIFSSKSFSQAYNRYKYYEQFSEHISEQLGNIKKIEDSVKVKKQHLAQLLQKKESLKQEKEQEQAKLLLQQQQKKQQITKLKAKEKDLLTRLKVQKRREQKLARQIQKVIKQNAKKIQNKKMAQQDIQLGKSFVSNKRKLPWPVSGIIFSRFGEHPHPVLKKVKIRNDGIDIACEKNSICKSIFSGEVSSIFGLQGLNSTVIIKHGNYLSVYANLSSIKVKKGMKVKTGQPLGTIATNSSNGTTILKFQIWKGTTCQNPELWLQKK